MLPLTAANREPFIQAINNVVAGGGTPLTASMAHAFKECTRQAKRQLGYGEYTIVVVTDGIAKDAAKLSGYVNAILRETPIIIYSIGFCIGENHSLNQPGRTVYKAAENPEQLREGLKEVLAESERFDITQFEQ